MGSYLTIRNERRDVGRIGCGDEFKIPFAKTSTILFRVLVVISSFVCLAVPVGSKPLLFVQISYFQKFPSVLLTILARHRLSRHCIWVLSTRTNQLFKIATCCNNAYTISDRSLNSARKSYTLYLHSHRIGLLERCRRS